MGRRGNQNINRYTRESDEVHFYVVRWTSKPKGMHYVEQHEKWFFEHEKELAINYKDKVSGWIPKWCFDEKISVNSKQFITYWTKAKSRTKSKPRKRWTHDIPTGVKDVEYKIKNGIKFTRPERRRMRKNGINPKEYRNNFYKDIFYED
tara:strand:- start:56 stop:502 length:447 start_codon:yes stop_codon:yes gene_type:complete